CLQDVQLLPTF
nr:immunoglobulin light chain junction region [Macaca mulatta]MOW43900.1 immunoglobulin light chain junction region [Macaca mulatta]